MNLSTLCSECGRLAAAVEVLAPAEWPDEYLTWSEADQQLYRRYADLGSWRLRYTGIEAGNGQGSTITADRAAAMIEILTAPIAVDRLDELGLHDDVGICRPCGVAYCGQHWRPGSSGYGHCPQGHGKSLDPHY